MTFLTILIGFFIWAGFTCFQTGLFFFFGLKSPLIFFLTVYFGRFLHALGFFWLRPTYNFASTDIRWSIDIYKIIWNRFMLLLKVKSFYSLAVPYLFLNNDGFYNFGNECRLRVDTTQFGFLVGPAVNMCRFLNSSIRKKTWIYCGT